MDPPILVTRNAPILMARMSVNVLAGFFKGISDLAVVSIGFCLLIIGLCKDLAQCKTSCVVDEHEHEHELPC